MVVQSAGLRGMQAAGEMQNALKEREKKVYRALEPRSRGRLCRGMAANIDHFGANVQPAAAYSRHSKRAANPMRRCT